MLPLWCQFFLSWPAHKAVVMWCVGQGLLDARSRERGKHRFQGFVAVWGEEPAGRHSGVSFCLFCFCQAAYLFVMPEEKL
ncbi:MAG: hypothetical protein A2Y91_04775 [Chloroflexi bacterium RBG_13_54_8]|nr:MAG: hypothetical protein A2Y91_04775 [Chloroflexi bacterium RBG_13_54_8]